MIEIGNVYGHWTVVAFDRKNKWGIKIYKCTCVCGRTSSVQAGSLKNGKSTNCGCKKSYNLKGKRFERLFVVERNGYYQQMQVVWKCQCDCGNEVNVKASSLVRGLTKSCGCLSADLASVRNSTHGASKTRLYRIWKGMRQRCLCKTNTVYRYYGGLGIKVCSRWDSYENFVEDMGDCPSEKHSIDRINPYGDYTPENCRWATATEQANNKKIHYDKRRLL